MDWTDPNRLTRLRELHALKLTYATMALIFNVSRSSISSAVRRHIHGIKDPRIRSVPLAQRTPRPAHYDTIHTFVEPWAQYTARKQKERAEARAAALKSELP